MRRIQPEIAGHRVRFRLGAMSVVVGVAFAVVLATAGNESSPPRPPGGSAPATTRTEPPVVVEEPSAQVGGVSGAAAADGYAAHLGAVVFGMDARRSTPERVRQSLQREADPGLTAPGIEDLYATIDARVPAEPLWERMRNNGQWSEWAPTRTWEPATWAQVVIQGHAAPGWTMRNVTGVQTTHYVEDGLSRTASHEATLSVVMRCPAPGVELPGCRLVLISTRPVF